MKKLQLYILFISMILVGCSESLDSSLENEGYNSSDTEILNNTSERNEGIAYDEEVLESVKHLYNENDDPINVISKVRTEYYQLNDKEIKEQVLEIYNDSILQLLSIKEPYELHNYFFKPDVIEMHYEDLLFDDVKQKIISSFTPVERTIINNELVYEFIKEFNEHIKVGSSFDDVKSWLYECDIEYNYIHSSLSNLLTIENEDITIQFKGGKVWRIFKLKDKSGNAVDPKKTLLMAAKEIAEMYQDKYERAIQQAIENEKIKIGMTKDEVLSRWGEPQKINKTTTAHNIREQWVYNNFKYIYFDNGIVTAIQE